jgi:hypothetical protein
MSEQLYYSVFVVSASFANWNIVVLSCLLLSSICKVTIEVFALHVWLHQIQRKAMIINLACSGYNQNTKKEIHFQHLYNMQGYQQIMYVLRHWRNQAIVRKMLTLVAWSQGNTGVSYLVHNNTSQQVPPQYESKWIELVREYLASMHDSNFHSTGGSVYPSYY